MKILYFLMKDISKGYNQDKMIILMEILSRFDFFVSWFEKFY